MKDFKSTVSNILAEITGLEDFEIHSLLTTPPDQKMGDLAFPCFKIAKDMSKKPLDVALDLEKKILKRLDSVEGVSSVKAFGPYLNFFVDKKFFFRSTVHRTITDSESKGSNTFCGTVVIDYSSPNIAKPIAFHHIRSTVIGNILGNIFEKNGYKVIRINYLGDWGTQFGKLITAFEKYGSDSELESKGIKHLLDVYVDYHKKEEPESDSRAREWFKKMEYGDEKALSYWRKFRDISIKEFDRVYRRLGIDFTYIEGESLYNEVSRDIIDEIGKKVGVFESDGAMVVDTGSKGVPPVLLKKTDGTTLYATRDIAAALDRWKRFSFTESLYVVAHQQELHFKQIFKLFKLMGYEWADKCQHVQFGLLHLEDAKMSSRGGNVIYLEEVLDKAVELARKAIEEKNPNLEEKDDVAEAVGIGAVIFGDISKRRIQDINFKWEDVLNFDGETAPYVQYTHARACSILEKSGIKEDKLIESLSSDYEPSDIELSIVKLISQFEDKLQMAQMEYEPFILARYALDLSREFNRYYYQEKIIDIQDKGVKAAKLLLVMAARDLISQTLAVLGIKAPKRM